MKNGILYVFLSFLVGGILCFLIIPNEVMEFFVQVSSKYYLKQIFLFVFFVFLVYEDTWKNLKKVETEKFCIFYIFLIFGTYVPVIMFLLNSTEMSRNLFNSFSFVLVASWLFAMYMLFDTAVSVAILGVIMGMIINMIAGCVEGYFRLALLIPVFCVSSLLLSPFLAEIYLRFQKRSGEHSIVN